MRKFLGLGAIAMLALSGCGKKEETTINTPDGKMKVSTEGSKTTLETEKGKVEVTGDGKEGTWTMTDEKGNRSTVTTGQNVDLDKLGVDLYAGATVNKDKGGMSSVDTPDGKMTTAILTTSDAPEKVLEFYKGKLKDSKSLGSGDAGLVTGKNAAGNDVQVTVSRDKDGKETTLTLTIVEKKK